MNKSFPAKSRKIPEVTLFFWIIKILVTTLWEAAGDAVSMSLNSVSFPD